MMKGKHCAQHSDWLDVADHWGLVNPGREVALHPLLECQRCGHRQSLQ